MEVAAGVVMDFSLLTPILSQARTLEEAHIAVDRVTLMLSSAGKRAELVDGLVKMTWKAGGSDR